MKLSHKLEFNSRKIVLPCLLLFALLCSAGCTQDIPYDSALYPEGMSLIHESEEDLVIHMDKELIEHLQVEKPSALPLTMSYRYHVGPSLKSNLKSVLDEAYRNVTVSSDNLDTLKGKSKVLDVKLVKTNFDVGMTIFSEHTTTLDIGYKMYKKDGTELFSLATSSSGVSKMTKNEKTLRFIKGLTGSTYSAPGWRASLGRSFDNAVNKSLSELMGQIKLYQKAKGTEKKQE